MSERYYSDWVARRFVMSGFGLRDDPEVGLAVWGSYFRAIDRAMVSEGYGLPIDSEAREES